MMLLYLSSQLLCILAMMVWGSAAQFQQDKHRCYYEKNHGMKTAVCHDLYLKEVPHYLKSDIEILDATLNRIRELYRTSFVKYSYLRYLYLEDNMILYIENGTFEPLKNLEVIDLSSNSLDSVPAEVLRLPKLRKLYMNGNRLNTPAGFLNAPVSETLEFVSLANCHLLELPPLDSFPYLRELNVSGNELRTVTTRNLAPLCTLRILDLTNNPDFYQSGKEADVCNCSLLSTWIQDKKIVLARKFSFDCSTISFEGYHHECANVTESEETLELHARCTTQVETRKAMMETQMTWIIVAIVLGISLLVFLLVLFWFHRRNRKHIKKLRRRDRVITNFNNNKKEDGLVSADEILCDSDT